MTAQLAAAARPASRNCGPSHRAAERANTPRDNFCSPTRGRLSVKPNRNRSYPQPVRKGSAIGPHRAVTLLCRPAYVLPQPGQVPLDIVDPDEFNLIQWILTALKNDPAAIDDAGSPPSFSFSPGRESSGATIDTDLDVASGDIFNGAVSPLVVRIDGSKLDRSMPSCGNVSWIVHGCHDLHVTVCGRGPVGKTGQDQLLVVPLPIADHDRSVPVVQAVRRNGSGPSAYLPALSAKELRSTGRFTCDYKPAARRAAMTTGLFGMSAHTISK